MDPASPLTAETLLQHEAFVLRLARTLVRGEAEAEDVAQSTLASALEHPPRHGALRAWLARVARNHARDLQRSEGRRASREARVARAEAVPAGESALERLELQNGVVRAVLALEEPYRSVVVATYYEGLAPAEIAERRGVPAGTVRSQLTRAHELLRAKFDREHGERASWVRGLAGLIALRGEPVADGGAAAVPASSGSGIGWPLVAAGIAACGAGVFVLRTALAPPRASGADAVAPGEVAMSALAPALREPAPQSPIRLAVPEPASARSVAASAQFQAADEPEELLEQSWQIKKLILDRRLAVTSEERARAGIPADTSTSGVVRLLERNVFGERTSLPWMRGGGSYYSFTERVHDYNRRPQIGLQDGNLLASFHGGSSSILIDLGDLRLADLSPSSDPPSGISRGRAFLWEVAQAEVDAEKQELRSVYARYLEDARRRGDVDTEIESELARLPRESVPAVAGHCYLARWVSAGEGDHLFAFEVLGVDAEQCTIAYRIRESRAVASPEPLRVPVLAPDAVALPDAALFRMSEPELRRALEAVSERSRQVILESFMPDVLGRFGALRDRNDAGLCRLVPYLSRWDELLTRQHPSRAAYSFLARTNDTACGDVSYQGTVGHGTLGDTLSGGGFGALVDLGSTSIEAVSVHSLAASGDATSYLAEHAFPHALELPANGPARWEAIRVAAAAEHEAEQAFRSRTHELGIRNSVRAVVGHTYAVRSVRFGSHDVLAAVHVAAEDELGAVIAFRVLATWPVLKRD